MKTILVDRNGIPRSCRIDLFTPIETKLQEALRAVEEEGAHQLLTDASVLIQQAKMKVSEYVDMKLSGFSVERDGVSDKYLNSPEIKEKFKNAFGCFE